MKIGKSRRCRHPPSSILHRRFAAICLTLCLACAFASTSRAIAGAITVHPHEDTSIILHNPDMGWTLYENYPLDQRPNGSSTLIALPGETYPGVDNVAIMFSWADVEPVRDQYDFSKVDHAYDYWHKLGKSIQLRMSTTSLLWWNNLNPPSGTGVPRYLLDELPPDCKQRRNCEGVDYTVVDSTYPLYRKRLKKFLATVAKHFGSHRPVTLIDLRGFGVWGEWHRGFRYPTLQQRRAALSGILDTWSAAFPKHWLALSYSFDPDGSDNVPYEIYVRYSDFDYARTKANITFRRDGCGGALRDNERRFANEVFRTLKKGPMSCEFVNGYAERKPLGRAHIRADIDDALGLHPNYINLIGYQSGDALAFMKEQPELFAYGLNNMGYRLVPTRIECPSQITADESARMDMTWVNRAVGRAMRDFRLVLTLADGDGKAIVSTDAGPILTSQWIKGRDYTISNLKFQFPKLEAISPGQYTLRFGLRDGDRPIALPLDGGRDGTYPVGNIEVK
jgi:hypothetical protein